MVKGLLDTTILIDLLRQYPLAEQWFVNQQNLGVAVSVWIEVLQGAQNSHDQRRALRLLNSLERVAVENTDHEWAVQSLLKFKLSHHVLGFDALIAATSYRLQVPLYTRNLKHFAPMLGSLAQLPY